MFHRTSGQGTCQGSKDDAESLSDGGQPGFLLRAHSHRKEFAQILNISTSAPAIAAARAAARLPSSAFPEVNLQVTPLWQRPR
jgi:hypothetical protein